MKRAMLKSKIHRATVTEAHIEYEGSVTIDRNHVQVDDAECRDRKGTRVFVDAANRPREID